MNAREVLDAAKTFLEFALGDEVEVEARETKLRGALDRLAVAYNSAEQRKSAEQREPPRQEYAVLRARVSALFPDLGFYNEALSISENVGTAEIGTADAIDDITDIALDLHDAVFAWENFGEDDALWRFRFGFETHWGRHLRGLQLYLHDRRF